MLSARLQERCYHHQPYFFGLCRQCYRGRFCGLRTFALRNSFELSQSAIIHTIVAAGVSPGFQHARQRTLAGAFPHRCFACRHHICHRLPARFGGTARAGRTHCAQHSLHAPGRPDCHDRGFRQARRVGHCCGRFYLRRRTQWRVGDWQHRSTLVESVVARK